MGSNTINTNSNTINDIITTTTTTTTVSTTTCPSGWTTSGSKCYKASTTDGDWLVAFKDCLSQGGSLAKPESAAENTVVQGLLNGGIGWIGLQDFKSENTFSWD